MFNRNRSGISRKPCWKAKKPAPATPITPIPPPPIKRFPILRSTVTGLYGQIPYFVLLKTLSPKQFPAFGPSHPRLKAPNFMLGVMLFPGVIPGVVTAAQQSPPVPVSVGAGFKPALGSFLYPFSVSLCGKSKIRVIRETCPELVLSLSKGKVEGSVVKTCPQHSRRVRGYRFLLPSAFSLLPF
jgi:hypothetical protein